MKRIHIVLALVFLFFGAFVAEQTILAEDPVPVINLCENKNGGITVYGDDFSSKDSCAENSSERPITVVGVAGPEGPQGVIGETGATGPQGPQSPAGVSGAGNVGFIVYENGSYFLLSTDGVIRRGQLYWAPDKHYKWIDEGRSVPIPVSDIVQWEYHYFLDSTGNVWVWEDGGYVNYGQP